VKIKHAIIPKERAKSRERHQKCWSTLIIKLTLYGTIGFWLGIRIGSRCVMERAFWMAVDR
jgi:hypothetical protein